MVHNSPTPIHFFWRIPLRSTRPRLYTGVSNMEIPNWLSVSGALIGLCGGAAGLVSGTVRARSYWMDKKAALRKDIAQSWTNQGDITSEETLLIDLDLKMHRGEIYGQLWTNAHSERLLEAHLDVHLSSATLRVSELLGSYLRPVAVVRLRLAGNRNRLKWKVIKGNSENWLPKKTLLW